ncbi:MAG TPA: oligoendopeptidase F [Candidatus Atribacteria bacterium]|nr:oligoendopeptidase F [Candidatus Atribacteria bacterium]
MTEAKRLPKRNEVPEDLKWRLEDIYSTQAAWEEDFRQVKDMLPRISSVRGTLGQSGDSLKQGLDLVARGAQKVEKLFVYARMKKDEDNGNSEAQALEERAQALMVEYESAVSFVVPEILSIPQETLDKYLAENKGLEEYDHYLRDISRRRVHTLSASEEMILAMAGEVAAAPGNIYTMLNNADMRFPTIRDENGNEVELTKGSYIQFMESRDRRVRQDAFRALYSTYRKQINTIASTLSSSIKKDIFYARVRKYNTDLEASLDDENVPVAVYDNLIETVHSHLPAMYKYVSLRKRALGVDELHMYDVYVPIVKDVEMKIPYSEAKEIVAEGLKPLGDDYIAILREGYQNGWIDVVENEGKTGGAYSWGCYDTHPYVLLNHHDNVDSTFTLAHEMGHAIHSYLSNKNQPYMKAEYKIFVAEVASTLNEILLTEHLLATLKDPRQKAYIINHYLEQFRGTVYRQTMFAEFEKLVHGMAEAGKPLTAETFTSVYRDLNAKYFGSEMVIDEEIGLEWARIPHFYRSFYVYKYATGFCAAAALAGRILKEGKPAVERYIRFLSSGGSDYPVNLLKAAGVDMTTSEPVSEALKAFSDMVDRLESLLL